MSKQNNSLPWDLLAAALISILALAATLLPPDLVRFSAPIGIILVLFLPGYAATIAIFPRSRDIAIKERLLVSLGIGIAIAIITAYSLSIIGKFDPASLARAIAIIALFAIAIAFIRWSSLPRGWRFIPNYKKDIGLYGGKKKVGIQRSAGVVLLAVAVIAVISAFAYTNTANTAITAKPDQKDEKGFTELYVVDDSSPAMATAGQSSALIVGIINREHHTADYTLRLALKGSALSEKSIKLNHNKSWEGPLSFAISSPGDLQRLDLLLYKDGDFSKPYGEKHILINVSDRTTQGSPKDNGKSAAKPKSYVANNGGSHSGGVSGSSRQNGGTEDKTTSVQKPQESPLKEDDAEVQEAEAEAEAKADSPAVVSNPPIPEETGQKEQPSPDINDNKRINISMENITLNVTAGINVVNASDIDQEIGEVEGKSDDQENQGNDIGIDINKNTNSDLYGSQNLSPPNSSMNVSKPGSVIDKELKHNLAANTSSNNISSNSMYNAPQIFYTRPKPGSSIPKEPAALEASSKPRTNEIDSDKMNVSGNSGVYKIQSTADSSSKGAVVSTVNPEGRPNAVQNRSDQGAATISPTQHITNQTANATNGVNASKSEARNKSLNASKNITSKAKTTAPHDEEVLRMAEMDRKIDSWVRTRGMGTANISQSYKSDIIQFTGKNNSVVLGSQSRAPKKVG